MSTGGLTLSGFIAPTVQELIEDLNAAILANLDPTLDLSPDQPLGQIVGIFAEKLAEQWEAIATIYNAMNPDAAEGNLLDNVSAITGSRRRSATYSKVVAQVNLNDLTTLPAGSVASVAGQATNRWVLITGVTNDTGSTASFNSNWRSELTGPYVANAGTLTTRETPVIGWNSITNALDALPGIPEDTDAILRVEREAELATAGSGTVDAIRAAVLLVPGVIQCFVFENTTLVPDSNGLPGKSIRVVVWDGSSPAADNVAIAQAIWDNKGSGIQAYGVLSATATDSGGRSREVHFARATQVPIYMSLTTTPSTLTSAQRQAVKDVLVAYGDMNLNLGDDVIALVFRAQVLGVPPVTDVPTFTLGTAPAPGGTSNISISDFQIATLDTTRILVNGL